MSLHATKHHECPTCRCTEPLEAYLSPITVRPLGWYMLYEDRAASALGLIYFVKYEDRKYQAYVGDRKIGEPQFKMADAKAVAQADFETKLFSMIERT